MNFFTKLGQGATATLLLACPVLAVAQQNIVHNLVRPSTSVADSTSLVPIADAPAFGAVIDYNQYPQLTDVPTIYINSSEMPAITGDMTKTETYYNATIVIVDKNGKMKQRNETVSIRGRGNSTWNSSSKKKPWRLKFGTKTKLLADWDMTNGTEVNNYANAKSWTLLCNVYDKSLIRNALTAELGKRAGLEFNPAYRFVDLVINGQYMGTYQVSDHVQVDKKRVNVDSKTGWFMEFSKYDMREDPWFKAADAITSIKNPETEVVSNDQTTDPQYDALKTWMNSYVSSLKNGNFETWRNQTDLTSLIAWLMVEELSGNFDGAMANVYTYKEADATQLKWGPLWDLDLAYGGYWSADDHFWNAQLGNGVGSYIAKMFEDPYFFKAYYQKWTEFKDGDNLMKFVNSTVTHLTTTIEQSRKLNFNTVNDSFRNGDPAWNITAGVSWAGGGVNSYETAISNLTNYISHRIDWLDSAYATMYTNLGCGSIGDVDPPTGPGSDPTTADRFVDNGAIDLWGYKPHCYTFYGSDKSMIEGAKVKMTFEGEDHVDLWLGASYASEWKKGVSNEFELTAKDVTDLAANGYAFSMYVWNNGGTCTSCVIDNGQTEGPGTGGTGDPTDDLQPGALVVNADGTYTFTGSATSFKAGAVITILTENVNATVSTQIAGNVWQNSKSITLTAEDVNKLKAAGYSFTISTSDAVKAITVKAPASQGTDGEKKTYNATIVNKCFSIPANDIPIGTEKISITIVGNGGYGIWVKYNLKGSSNEYDNNTKIVKDWDSNTRTVSFDITDAAEISNARTYGINILTGDFLTATITMICSGSGIATTPTVTPTRTLSLTASKGGSVSGAGTYDENTTVIIKAVAAEGYKFKGWSDGNTLATRSVTLTSDNISLTATFEAEREETPGEDDSDPFNEKGEHQQLTNLPTIYLAATVGDNWSGATLEVFDKDNMLGQGTAWTKTTADLSVQFQGSGEKNKDSYRLKFESKIKLMGANKYKQWVLLANDDDPSLMRNALAKEMGDVLGLPFTPGYQFVDLYVNNAYMGTYQVTDRIKAEDGRALITGGDKEADWHVRLNDETEYREDNPMYFIAGSETMPYIIPKNPDPKDDVTTWNNSLSEAMTTYFKSLFAKTDGTAFADGVDKQQLIQWYVAQEILCVYKGFSSIEAYRSVTAPDQDLHIGILWDNEKSMGNLGEAPKLRMDDLSTENSYQGLMTNYAAYGLMKNIFTDLWQQAWFANGVKNLWDEKNEAVLSAMKVKAGELKEVLTESQELDAAKWKSTANYNDAVSELTSWLDNRFTYLDTKFTALADALPCTNHTYNNNEYAQVEDKTYRRACDNCGAAEEGDEAEVYYQFEVYTTSKTPAVKKMTDDPEWPSKQDVTNQPNTLYVTEAADLTGTNVVSAGNCSQLVITDGYPFYNPAEFKAQEASYKRTVKAETQWGTVCLPFKVVDNDDVALFTLTEVTTRGDDSKPGLMTFSPATKTGKATPLVFRKKTSDATEVCFTAGKKNGSTITVAESKDCDKNISEEVSVPGWQLFGNVKKTQSKDYTKLAPESYTNIYVISGDKFWHATGTVTIAPFRAFFGQADTEQGPAAAQFRICINGTDGIDYIEQEVRHEAPTYDIQGRKVRAGHEAAKGLYVVDGKKILVR